MAEQIRVVRLILGDQLSDYHSWYPQVDPSILYVMMEVRPETEYVTHHIQKLVAVLSAMRLFAQSLQEKGHRVRYWKIADPDNHHSFVGNLAQLITKGSPPSIEYQTPDEYRLQQILGQELGTLGVAVREVDTEHFLSTPGDFRRGQRMETFYRGMRRKTGYLMDGDQPRGGSWNYDAENRKAWKGSPSPPVAPNLSTHAEVRAQVLADLDAAGVPWFGSMPADGWWWPVTATEARQGLHDFLATALANFGDYQDALAPGQPILFHSLLSFGLNTKLVHPREVIEKAIEAATAQGSGVSLPSLEGFVRQILGWREYMRQFYQASMPDFRRTNFFGAHRPLPDWYWTGDTQMACLADSIGSSLQNAYAHHISRLMVTGNFALLAGVHPDEVDRWYLGVYIDAFEWVEITNTRGMSQYADGGGVASKPYAASAAYIQRMGGPCKSCAYDPKKRHGSNACPFNSLYWGFIDQYREKFAKNPRMAMPLRTWDKFDENERRAILQQRKTYLSDLLRGSDYGKE